MEAHTAGQLLEFLHLAGRLKQTARAGWTLRGIERPESVADHTFRVCLMAMVLAPGADPPVDRARCLSMALVHDLAESLVGDITPYDGVAPEEKRRREHDALIRLSALAGAPEILELWAEYDRAETAEARFVKELDKLETVLQAAEYEADGNTELAEFWRMGERALASPQARALLAALSAGRRG